MSPAPGWCPAADCLLCPRLAEFRQANRAARPDWFNAPVPSFGQLEARLLIVGLAPGLRGANRTGRPFTGDFAGDLLYRTLLRFGLDGFGCGLHDVRTEYARTRVVRQGGDDTGAGAAHGYYKRRGTSRQIEGV